jgi:hypothetical protein
MVDDNSSGIFANCVLDCRLLWVSKVRVRYNEEGRNEECSERKSPEQDR